MTSYREVVALEQWNVQTNSATGDLSGSAASIECFLSAYKALPPTLPHLYSLHVLQSS